MKGIPSGISPPEGNPSFSFHEFFAVSCPIAVGSLLVLAASFKFYSLFSEPILGSPWPKVLLIELEVALGLALWLRVWPCATRWVALAVFGIQRKAIKRIDIIF